MTTRELLNSCEQANFLLGKYMIWKHSEGWSATNIRTGEYFTDVFDWEDRKKHVTDKTGRNYWTDIEVMLKHLLEDMNK